ncbi:nitroreductase [Rhizobium sp. CG5]|uniref:nitroreductase family protein n=1 Tax=Rhizobium sp. CG5 TaxID=2726076 RepID=UPI002033A897|nr:nitroreductase family protein [Rhizobium sp. CG5]MCM2475026.1 nitroreductase [Rhizobium sp. CG5]
MNARTVSRSADHPIEDFFTARWSPRAFTAETVSEPELLGLLEAARWAPSGLNAQPWRFVYSFRGEVEFDAILASLWTGNQVWAKNAAALIAVAAKTTLIPPGADKEIVNPSYGFDAGAAWGYFAIQAHLNGWSSHAMGGFDAERAAEAIAMPDGYAMQVVIAVGKRASAETLPEVLRNRETPSPRRPITESAFRGKFAFLADTDGYQP